MNRTHDEFVMAYIENIKKENKMYKMILEALPVNLFVKDKTCKYQITSRKCDSDNSVERGALKGKTDFDLQNSQDIAQSFYDEDQKIMASGQGSHILSPAHCGNELKYYDIYKEPLIDSNNQVAGIVGVVIDPGSAALNKDYINLTDFQNVDSIIFDYDLNTDKIMVLKDATSPDHLCKIKSCLEEGKFDLERIDDDYKDIFLKQFQKIRDGEKICISLIKMRDYNDQWRYCELSLTAVFDQNLTANRAIGILSCMEEKLKGKEKINVSAVEVKRHLNSIITHRFETIFYINLNLGWYQVVENTIPGLALTGSIQEFYAFCSEKMNEYDIKEIADFMHKCHVVSTTYTSGNKSARDVYAIFEKKIKRDKEYGWNEIEVYPILSLDGKSMDYVITVSDVDGMVKERKHHEIRQANNQIIEVLSSVVESRDLESGNHIKRIKEVTKELLEAVMVHYPEYGLDKSMIEVIVSASAMHDIGKIAIPDTILLKAGTLTKEEFEIVKEHTLRGCDIINNASAIQDQEYYNYCYDICRHHHERYDGRGYPDGLKADEISIAAQVVSLADVYDSLLSKRCYKESYEEDLAFEMIMNGECGHFNPILIKCFKMVRENLKMLY